MAVQEEINLATIIDLQKHPINEDHYREKCKAELDKSGVLVLDNFLYESSIKSILSEAKKQENLAYYCTNEHNVYLDPFDKNLSKTHPRNKTVTSSKGCITDDQVPKKSSLRALYNSLKFKDFCVMYLMKQSYISTMIIYLQSIFTLPKKGKSLGGILTTLHLRLLF
jgi:hypothetical protein